MIVNRQSGARVSPARLGNFLAKVEKALRLPSGAVTVCFVTEPAITRLNRAFRGHRGSTDVLSFPADGRRDARRRAGANVSRRAASAWVTKFAPGSYLGDVAIAPGVARRNARRAGRSVENELRMLILHGVLHLMGYDHETDSGEMDRRERSLRRRWRLA